MRWFVSLLMLSLLVACGSTEVKKESAEPSGPNPSFVSAQGITVYPGEYFWKDFKHYSKSGAVNFYIRKILPGETLKDAIARSRFEPHHGEAVARYNTQKMTIPILNHKSGACYYVSDLRGRPAKIRPSSDLSAYVFTNDAIDFNNQKVADYNKLKSLDAIISREQNKREAINSNIITNKTDIRRLSNQLNASAAYRDDQCVLVPQKQVPPRPAKKNQTFVKAISEGYCLDKIYYRNSDWRSKNSIFPPERQNSLQKSYNLFSLNERKPIYSCHKVNFSQWNDVGCNFTAGVLDIIGLGRTTRKECFQNAINSCTAKAVSSCNYEYDNWLNVKSRIESEPAKLKNQCLTNVRSMTQKTSRSQLLEQELMQQRESIIKAKSARDEYASALSQKKYIDKVGIDSAVCKL